MRTHRTRYFAELEKRERRVTVVTQNIDGLHREAGSKNVIELHGSVLRNHCMQCGKFYGVETILKTDDIPALFLRRRRQAGRGFI